MSERTRFPLGATSRSSTCPNCPRPDPSLPNSSTSWRSAADALPRRLSSRKIATANVPSLPSQLIDDRYRRRSAAKQPSPSNGPVDRRPVNLHVPGGARRRRAAVESGLGLQDPVHRRAWDPARRLADEPAVEVEPQRPRRPRGGRGMPGAVSGAGLECVLVVVAGPALAVAEGADLLVEAALG